MDSQWVLPEFASLAISSPLFFYALIVVGLGMLVVGLHPSSRRLLGAGLRRAWLLFRQMLGWLLIAIGILGMMLPGPGIPFFVLGVLLVGRRHHLLRRSWVVLRWHLRRLGRRPGLIGRGAQLAHRQLQHVRTQVRPMFRDVGARLHRQGKDLH